MDYKMVATQILDKIGGKGNLVSAAHCATRLRLVIADNQKADKTALENIDGVKGVFEASGQLQIILGTGTVNKVYDEFIKESGVSAATKEEVKQAASAKANWFQRAIKALGDVFVPIIPAIVASGLLMGLLEGLCNVFPQMATSSTYTIFHLFSNAAFCFLPILIAVSAAKVFGGNPYLGAVIGMIMIHGDLMNAWNVASAESIPTAKVWFGLYDINLVGYQGHVIPVVIAVWFMSMIEKKLHKISPEMIDLFVTPLVTVLVTGYLTLTVFGPIFSTLENWVLDAAKKLILLPMGIGGMLIGAVYAPTVVAGIHHMYNALEAGMLSANGVNTWMPIATAANVAQGAAALAFALKTKNTKTKAMAFPASLSAFLGITEPAIFGVNLRYMKPFIAGCIGGACGGLVAGLTHVGASAYGITGLFGYLITTEYTLSYTLIMVVSIVVGFILSWILYTEKIPESTDRKTEEMCSVKSSEVQSVGQNAKTEEKAEEKADKEATEGTVYAPIEGMVILLSETPDETFASGALGEGVAIVPANGVVVAPFDGEVTMVFDTKHALGLMSQDGVELLIHVGMNTVELGGSAFEVFVKAGDQIKKGQKLLSFEIEAIKKAGYQIETPVIVTNADDYQKVDVIKLGSTKQKEVLLKVEK